MFQLDNQAHIYTLTSINCDKTGEEQHSKEMIANRGLQETNILSILLVGRLTAGTTTKAGTWKLNKPLLEIVEEKEKIKRRKLLIYYPRNTTLP